MNSKKFLIMKIVRETIKRSSIQKIFEFLKKCLLIQKKFLIIEKSLHIEEKT